MKIIILATEASGDFLGSELIKQLKKKKVEIFGVGGELMSSQGLQSWVPITSFNAIGIYEVMIRIFKFIKIFRYIKKKIVECNPDLVITIDSPSFSYRIVQKLQCLRPNTKFIHYVAPTVWAWKSYRAKVFSKLYDKIFTLFDFEPIYFSKFGLNAEFVGHQIFFKKKTKKNTKKIISFFPGSRSVEIKNNIKKLKRIITTSNLMFKEFKLYILTFDHEKKFLEKYINLKNVNIICDNKEKHEIMQSSYLAVAASGSVSLELIHYETPTIIFYETHWFTKFLIKLLVKVKYASIINIFYNKEVIPEFLFENFKHDKVIKKIETFIYEENEKLLQLEFFRDFSKKMLVDGQNPSTIILKRLGI